MSDMAYMNRELRNLVEEMDRTFKLPRDWNKFLFQIQKNHNIILKNKGSYYCTNCQNTFEIKTKVKVTHMYKCPFCKKKLQIRSNKLKHLTYRDNVMIIDKCNNELILRVFEMESIYNPNRQEFEHSTVEYARKLIEKDFRELRNERITPGMTSFSVNHYMTENGKWRLYDGWWQGADNIGYLYKNNIKNVLNGTKYERSRLWDFVRNQYDEGYDAKRLFYVANSEMFETLVELKLYNLAFVAECFHKAGSFKKIFGIGKDYYEFMKKNDITYEELKVLRIYPTKNIKELRFLRKYSNSIDEINRYMSLDKFIRYFKSNNLSDARLYLDYLKFAEKLGIDLKNKRYLFPENLKEMHDEYEKQIETAKQKKLANEILKRARMLKRNIFKNKTFIIFPAENVQALIDESAQQNNCVRTYAEEYAKGNCDIYFMRYVKNQKVSLVTVEVKENKVVQKRIKNNEKTTSTQNKFLKLWEEKILNKIAV